MDQRDQAAARRRETGARLRSGEFVHGFMLTASVQSDFAAALRPDFVIVEREHSQLGLTDIGPLLRILNLAGTLSLVRIAEIRYAEISRVLDAGADGVLVPRIRTRAELDEVVHSARLPPRGGKGVGGYDFAVDDLTAKIADYSASKLILLQVENAACLDNLDDLLDTGEVAGVIVGPFDLSLDLGIPGQFEHPRFVEAVEQTIRVAAHHHTASGMMMHTPDVVRRWRPSGMSIYWLGTEVSLARMGYQAIRQAAADPRRHS